MKIIRGRGGHEIEVVTRPQSKKRKEKESRPTLGASNLGERVQKDPTISERYIQKTGLSTFSYTLMDQWW